MPSEKPPCTRKVNVIANDIQNYMSLNWHVHWPQVLDFKYSSLNVSEVKFDFYAFVSGTEEAWAANVSLQHRLQSNLFYK